MISRNIAARGPFTSMNTARRFTVSKFSSSLASVRHARSSDLRMLRIPSNYISTGFTVREFSTNTHLGFRQSFPSFDKDPKKDNEDKNKNKKDNKGDEKDQEFKNISDYFKSKEFFRSLYLAVVLTIPSSTH